MSNSSHLETRSNTTSSYPQNQAGHPSYYRAQTPYWVEPPEGYYVAPPLAPTTAYFSSMSTYPPHYTAPTPRYMTPDPDYVSAGAYPTPEASPDVRGQYVKLLPEEGGQGQENGNEKGEGGASSASAPRRSKRIKLSKTSK